VAEQENSQDLVAPFAEIDALEPSEVVEEIQTRTEYALALEAASPEARAAAGLVVAIGNYEVTTGRRDPSILQAATERLKELEEDERSKYW
jgi:hypothetical protein